MAINKTFADLSFAEFTACLTYLLFIYLDLHEFVVTNLPGVKLLNIIIMYSDYRQIRMTFQKQNLYTFQNTFKKQIRSF